MRVVVVVPVAVPEVVVIVGDFGTVQPVNGVRERRVAGLAAHHDAGGGVPRGAHGGRTADGAERGRVCLDVAVPRMVAGAGANERVVVADAAGTSVPFVLRLEQQPKLFARIDAAGSEGPVLRHDTDVHDLNVGCALRTQREAPRRRGDGDAERLVVLDGRVRRYGDIEGVTGRVGGHRHRVRSCCEVCVRRRRACGGRDGERRLARGRRTEGQRRREVLAFERVIVCPAKLNGLRGKIRNESPSKKQRGKQRRPEKPANRRRRKHCCLYGSILFRGLRTRLVGAGECCRISPQKVRNRKRQVNACKLIFW